MIIEDMRLNIEFFENCVIKPSNDIRKEKTHEHPQAYRLQTTEPCFPKWTNSWQNSYRKWNCTVKSVGWSVAERKRVRLLQRPSTCK